MKAKFWSSNGRLKATAVAGAAVAAVAGFVALWAITASDGAGKVSAQGGLAAQVAFVPASEPGRPARIQIIGSTGNPRSVGTADEFSKVLFSPNGATLAGLAAQSASDDVPALHLIDTKTGSERLLKLSPDDLASEMLWSPASTAVAVIGRVTTLFASTGEVLAAVAVDARAGQPSNSFFSGGFAWSPDGKQFAVLANGRFIAFTFGGATVNLAGSDIAGVKDPVRTYLLGWVVASDNSAWVLLDSFGESVAVNPFSGTSRSLLASDSVISGIDAGGRAKALVMADASAAGTRPVWAHSSADGFGVLGEIRAADGASEGATRYLVVLDPRRPGARLTVTGLSPENARGGALVDAVLLP